MARALSDRGHADPAGCREGHGKSCGAGAPTMNEPELGSCMWIRSCAWAALANDLIEAPAAVDALSSCWPRSSNSRPHPATRSFTVCETSTSEGPAAAPTRAPMSTAIPPTCRLSPRTRLCEAPPSPRSRAASSARRLPGRIGCHERGRFERGEEPAACGVDLGATEPP